MSPPVFACPVCGEDLPPAPGSYVCVNGHRFDIAREGYVNLLLAHHRRSKEPGYSKEMIAGRRDFFAAGHFAPAGPASRRDPQGLYAVADTYRIPVLAGRVDVLLSHFSPVNAEDFRRVVKPGGAVLVGVPGERHLFRFKELLYESPAAHEPVAMLADESGFELIDTDVIHYPLQVRGPGQVANLLLMTPYSWSVDDETCARIGALDALDTELEIVLHTYRRTELPATGE